MAKKTQTPPKSFEEAQRELEQIVSQMDRGDVTLEESLLKYERGVFLIGYCREILDAAEKQIDLLTKNSEGNPQTSPAPT